MEARARDEHSAERSRAGAAQQALAENPKLWYHAIELAPGLVTPGYIDLRGAAPRVLPDDLRDKRALDVGTFDGFWAFELERRGAEVVTIDLERIEEADFPPLARAQNERRARAEGFELGAGFRLARRALGSGVERVTCDVYDLTPERIAGEVDFAFCGAVLTHLRDPVGALERIHDALRPGAELRLYEPVSWRLSLRSPRRPAAEFRAAQSDYTWWLPNLTAMAAWTKAAGFGPARRLAITRPPCKERSDLYVGFACSRDPRSSGDGSTERRPA